MRRSPSTCPNPSPILPASVPPSPRPVVLVTGCSSGIGRESVLHLRKAGALVIASARRLDTIRDLEAPGEVETLRLDVASASDRAGAVAEVLQDHGRIDALVNNAGFGAILAVEDTSVEAMQAMFDVNVFGLHDLARRVLPTMRKQGHGRIVNISSVAGHVPVPMMGAYCASKFAVRALTQTLDMEVRSLGIRALLVEPGPIATRFGNRTLTEQQAHLPGADASPYARHYAQWTRRRGEGGRGVPASRVARKVVHACLAAAPRSHYFVPASASATNLAKRLLPDAWVMGLMRAYFRQR